MRCVERFVYFFCSTVVLFACLGTFASYFLSTRTNETHKQTTRIVKIVCPLVMIGGFILMAITRCCFQEKPRNPANLQGGELFWRRSQIDGLQANGVGYGNRSFYWHELDVYTLPTYSESVNNPRCSIRQGELPPKYEDIMGTIMDNEGLESEEMHEACQDSLELSTSSGRVINVLSQTSPAQDCEIEMIINGNNSNNRNSCNDNSNNDNDDSNNNICSEKINENNATNLDREK